MGIEHRMRLIFIATVLCQNYFNFIKTKKVMQLVYIRFSAADPDLHASLLVLLVGRSNFHLTELQKEIGLRYSTSITYWFSYLYLGLNLTFEHQQLLLLWYIKSSI